MNTRICTAQLIITQLIITSAVLLGGCHNDDAQQQSTLPQVVNDTTVRFPDQALPDSIKTGPVGVEQDAQRSIPGRLVWDEDHTVRIYSEFGGRVVHISVNLGDFVKAGQALAELESPDYGSAQADHMKAIAARNLAASSLARARDLYQHGVISAREMQQSESDAASADAEAERTDRVMRQFHDDGKAIDQRLVIRSPIDGVVVERAINPGQEVRSDQVTPPLFVITNPANLWVSLDAHEEDLLNLKVGDPFTFSVDRNAAQTFSAKITRIADYVDPVTRSIRILGSAPNPEHQLKGEMFLTAALHSRHDADARVPSAAILLIGDQHFAFVKQGSAFIKREVTIGGENSGRIAVLSGLQHGDEVVTEGALFLEQLLHSQSQS